MQRIMKKSVAFILSVALLLSAVCSSLVFAADDAVNLTQNKPAMATFEQLGTGADSYNAYAENAVNGNFADRWSTFGAPSGTSHIIMIDLGVKCELDSLSFWWFGDNRKYTYDIYVTDKPVLVNQVKQEGFEPVASVAESSVAGSGSGAATSSANKDKEDIYTFTEKPKGRYLTIDAKCLNNSSVGLWEMEAYGRAVEDFDPNNIISVPRMDDVNVLKGTKEADLDLPESIEVALAGGNKAALPVIWSCDNYNAAVPGTYTFTGALTLENDVANENELSANINVVVVDELNLALNKPVTVTHEENGNNPDADQGHAKYAVDGDRGTRWSSYGAAVRLPHSITVDLEKTYKINHLTTYFFHDRTYTYNVYVTDEPILENGVVKEGVAPVVTGATGKGSGFANAGQSGSLASDCPLPENTFGRYVTVETTAVTGSGAGQATTIWELMIYGANASADYSAVEEAIASVPENLDIYTEESRKALQEKIDAVEYGLNADQQDAVDKYAEDILEAIAALVTKLDLDISISISDGVSVAAETDGRYNITWNANILIGETETLDSINEKIICKDYGVCYGTSKAAIDTLTSGKETSAARMMSFVPGGAGENVNVYTIFGFRLKNTPAGSERAAQFYFTFEYEGVEHTVYSDCVTCTAE